MEVSLMGNFNAVNRALVTPAQDDSDNEIRQHSDSARTDETLSRESEVSAVPPAHAPGEVPDEHNEQLPSEKNAGRQINITI